ncbi:MATE efflux family protein [Salvia divinorum]|uniref:MATE efflux family protein n=1 Tax=Salvia divinorum TaxID=28513 RepID=A0ABD1HF79_SALDI
MPSGDHNASQQHLASHIRRCLRRRLASTSSIHQLGLLLYFWSALELSSWLQGQPWIYGNLVRHDSWAGTMLLLCLLLYKTSWNKEVEQTTERLKNWGGQHTSLTNKLGLGC